MTRSSRSYVTGVHQKMSTQSSRSSRRDSIARNRWLVHCALIIAFLGVVISAIFLSKPYLGHSGVTDHAIIGFIILGLVVAHLLQRRHAVRRLLTRLANRETLTATRSSQGASDLILWLLTLNAMISGTTDFLIGHQILLPIPGPIIIEKWHAFSALVLLIYVMVHVIRRRSRLRTSRIR